MRSSLAVVAVLAAAGALAVATAGAPFSDQLEDSEITLENASGPNGVYAVEENGELAIRITEARQQLAADGVNPDGVTVIEDIFRITYGGEESADVWIETAVEDVEFRTETGSIEGQANSVRLGTGESERSVLVGLRIDTTGDHDVETIEEFTVNANVTDGTGETNTTTESNTGATNAAVGDGGEDTVGDPDDSGESGDTSDGSEEGDVEGGEGTTQDDEDGTGDEQRDSGETTPDDEGGDDRSGDGGEDNDSQAGDQAGEPDDDGPDTDPGTDDGESLTDGNDDGTTAGDGDAPADLSQSGQPVVFEPAQTLGGFLPQLVGLLVAIAGGAGLVAAARAIAGAGGN